MSAARARSAPGWPVRRTLGPDFTTAWTTPEALGPDWRPLEQAWREQPEKDFNAGWAHLRWYPGGLLVEGLFHGAHQTNAARRLNERTWELGSVFEFFLRADGCEHYLELHVTPENQRLQLLWPEGGLEAFRAGRAALADFLVNDPAWVTSETRVARDHWAVRLEIPFHCIGLAPSATLPAMYAAVCRYDLATGREVLSSTARLPAPNYHLQAHWSRLQFAG